ncbi:MAG: riboflavin biosynthesis protein RibF [Clostridiales Family XIII bacterium]|jgi:riboflavin kinase/FMN adenylyltransferase|nr:riboflavin biosynthesis protein RibF [Clostridiales Family XIII bacterium]
MMKIFTSIEQIADIPQTAVALGNFDGVHLGHTELIRRSVTYARERGLSPAVFTFSNHPYNVISGNPLIRSVITQEDKERLLSALGVEYIFSFKFDEGFHTMLPEEFIERALLGAMRARAVFCGFNFRFGSAAAGSPDMLRVAAASKGFDLVVMEPYRVDGALVSSTMVRELIEAGDVAEAEKFLGRPFTISGEITRGNGLGRGFGFPTANIALPDGFVVPAYGVYVTESELGADTRRSLHGNGAEGYSSRVMRSVTNVGVRPTIGDDRLLAETHILGAEYGDLYGHRIRVGFLSMIRPERRFVGTGELIVQVERDKDAALGYRS